MRSLETLARTLIALVTLPLLLFGVSIGALLQTLFVRPRQRDVQWAYRIFSRAFVGIAGGALRVSGREHVDAEQSYVVVSNHESNLDPFSLMSALPELRIRFVIKRQIMQIPVFGHALAATGNVTVDRRGSGDVKRIRDTMSHRDPEVSLLFFAEGTRSRDGSFREFKKGAFATAIKEGLPILPVAVAGTYASLPPSAKALHKVAMAVEIGEPIPTAELGHSDRAALLESVHKQVAELRTRARASVRAAGDEPGGVD